MDQPAVEAKAPDLKKTALALGLGLFLFAFLIRLLGINWGLPDANKNYSYHPDEFVTWFYSQQIDPAKGDFTPGFYNYGTLYLTLLNVGTSMTNAYGGGPASQTPEAQHAAVGRYHKVGRIIASLAGAGLAWIVFLMLYRRTSLLGASFGGLAVALSPALVVHSRFQSVDVLGAFLAAVSIYFAMRLASPYLDEPEADAKLRLKWAIWAGVFAGLSAGTKYNGGLAFLALLPLFWPLKAKDAPKLVGLAAGTAFLAFLIATPGFVAESGAFWRDFTYEMKHTSEGHGLVFTGTSPGFLYHLGNLAFGMGVLMLILGIVGLVMAARRKETWLYGAIAFAAIFYLLIGRAEIKFMRYVFPLIPVLAVGFGWWVGRMQEIGGMKGRFGVMGAIIAVGGILGGGAMGTMISTYWMQGNDPRDQALAWMRENAETSTVGYVSDPWFYSVPFFADATAPRMVSPSDRWSAMAEQSRPQATLYVPDDPAERRDWDPRLITEAKPDYIVFSSFESDDLSRIAKMGWKGEDVDRYRVFFEELEKNYGQTSVMEFGTDGPSIHDMMYIRPRVWIWKRQTDSEKISNGSSTGSVESAEPAATP